VFGTSFKFNTFIVLRVDVVLCVGGIRREASITHKRRMDHDYQPDGGDAECILPSMRTSRSFVSEIVKGIRYR
jgi:hypothetical protein